MLSGRAGDIKRHRWFEGMEWDAMAARRVQPPRIPQDDAAKRMRELAVRVSILGIWFSCRQEQSVPLMLFVPSAGSLASGWLLHKFGLHTPAGRLGSRMWMLE